MKRTHEKRAKANCSFVVVSEHAAKYKDGHRLLLAGLFSGVEADVFPYEQEPFYVAFRVELTSGDARPGGTVSVEWFDPSGQSLFVISSNHDRSGNPLIAAPDFPFLVFEDCIRLKDVSFETPGVYRVVLSVEGVGELAATQIAVLRKSQEREALV